MIDIKHDASFWYVPGRFISDRHHQYLGNCWVRGKALFNLPRIHIPNIARKYIVFARDIVELALGILLEKVACAV